ncbi:MAG: hypothetical protein H0X70_00930 [Segetibacter sp.]|nr:hypothetical protein [Segetibacter sp.]
MFSDFLRYFQRWDYSKDRKKVNGRRRSCTSGIIAGYVENGINYGRVGERLQNHPLFKNTLPASKLKKLTKYAGQHFAL